MATYAEEVGQVAHNSFVHTYVELGLFGGTMFFGCFYFAMRALLDQRKQPEVIDDPISRRRTTLVLAILAGAAASMLSLSRAYGVPAYMIHRDGRSRGRTQWRASPLHFAADGHGQRAEAGVGEFFVCD